MGGWGYSGVVMAEVSKSPMRSFIGGGGGGGYSAAQNREYSDFFYNIPAPQVKLCITDSPSHIRLMTDHWPTVISSDETFTTQMWIKDITWHLTHELWILPQSACKQIRYN